MTIQLTIRRDNVQNPEQKATIIALDYSQEGELIGDTELAELAPGEEVTVHISKSRRIEIGET